MKKIFTLILLSLSIFKSSSHAQTISCNAEFNVQYLSSNLIQFNPLLTGDPLTTHHYWTFGDGGSANTVVPTHTYLITGAFIAKHYVYKTNLNGTVICRDTFARVVQIQPDCDLVANFSFSLATTPFTYHFNNTSIPLSNTDSIRWTFGDGTSSNLVSPNHTYNTSGTYTVCLRVQKRYPDGISNCVREICKTIVVGPVCNLQAHFTWHADPVNPRKIIFTNQTISPTAAATATWSFGDGTIANGWNSMHEYAQPGRYKVCLRVEAGPDCISYTCDSITVAPLPPCNIQARYTWAADPNNNRKIIFTNQTESPNSDAIATWSFGDGTTGTGWNAVHEYSQPGRYYVCLKVQFGPDCISYKCDSITVHTVPPCHLQVAFIWRADPVNPKKIIFTNQTLTTTASATAIWSFGDGTSSSAWNPVHEYAQPGRYYVCLRVQLTPTCVSYYCDTVFVHRPVPGCIEQSNFRFSHSSADRQLYHFTPSYINNDWRYTWTFGDGTGSHDINATHRYSRPGNYTVCLTVFRNANCASTTCKPVSVLPQPNCEDIRVTYNYQRDPLIVNKLYFHAIANSPLIDQTWTITKLPSTVSTPPVILHQNNPTYIFRDIGYYRVCLRAVTVSGCVKEYCQVIRIERITTTNSCILQTYPNPASTQVSVIVLLSQPQLIHVYIYNSLNILVKEKHQAGVEGSNVVTLAIGDLVAGSYNIKVVRGNDVCYARFQKI